jgi:hypothetical protein
MKTLILILLTVIPSLHPISQDFLNSNSTEYKMLNGYLQTRTITNGVPVNDNSVSPVFIQPDFTSASSMIRWSFTDPIAIGDRSAASGNGLYQTTGWGLNSERVSVYNNTSSTPVWEFPTSTNVSINYVAISDTGGVIAAGSYHNIYLFNRSSSTPFFNYNLETQLVDTGFAGPVDLTGNGRFLIACASRSDSSWIFGFSRDSASPVWRYRVGQQGAGGASIQGVKISGNDSLVIVNTYGGFYVFRTYTGQLLYSGLINPTSPSSGTQFPQGISGNGSIIATINYSGNLRVYQWNGSTYNFLWQNSESGHWMSAVDVSYDGSMVACGTLNFLGGSNYDGKVKFLKVANGSTPVWTYSGCGDEVTCVSFSKDGKILAAASWGDLSNLNNDLLVFKTSVLTPSPIFAVNSPGSFFWCSASDNGSTVVASGKRIHARAFGNGGEVYNIFIDTNDTPLGIGNNSVPVTFNLHQNYPNPFNPVTRINYDIPANENVKLVLYDMLGREVKTLVDKFHSAGRYSLTLNAEDLTSGVYFYKIFAGNFFDSKKLVLVK